MNDSLLSVYIVDDELPIRQELRMIPWEKYGALLVGEGTNGKEALSFCKLNKPDIVITDITMPLMDGIQFTKLLTEAHPQTQIIFLTCHNNFEYAQAGIELGILGYIEKVFFEESDIEPLLKKARHNIMKLQNHEQSYKETLRNNKQKLFIKYLYEQHELSADDKKYFSFPMYPVILNCHFKKATIYMESIIHQILTNQLGVQWIKLETGLYMLFMDSFISEEKLTEECNSITQNLYDNFDNLNELLHEEYYFCIILGHIIKDSTVLLTEYKGLKENINFFFYNQKRIFLATNERLNINKDINEMKKNIHSIIVAMYKKSINHLESYLDELFNYCSEKCINPDLLKSTIISYIGSLYEYHNIDDFEYVERIYSTYTFEELTHALTYSYNLINNNSSLRHEVRKAIEMIETNYHLSITLQSIAECIQITPHYLGKLFKQQIGESFNVYLNKYRINQAVKEIKSTNKKVYEIANDVGIPSYRYFLILFKEYTGKTPSEYK